MGFPGQFNWFSEYKGLNSDAFAEYTGMYLWIWIEQVVRPVVKARAECFHLHGHPDASDTIELDKHKTRDFFDQLATAAKDVIRQEIVADILWHGEISCSVICTQELKFISTDLCKGLSKQFKKTRHESSMELSRMIKQSELPRDATQIVCVLENLVVQATEKAVAHLDLNKICKEGCKRAKDSRTRTHYTGLRRGHEPRKKWFDPDLHPSLQKMRSLSASWVPPA